MTHFTLTVGNSTVGFSRVEVGIGQAAKTGALVPTFTSPKWTKGIPRQHAEVLRSAARQLAVAIDDANTGTINGFSKAGDCFPVAVAKRIAE